MDPCLISMNAMVARVDSSESANILIARPLRTEMNFHRCGKRERVDIFDGKTLESSSIQNEKEQWPDGGLVNVSCRQTERVNVFTKITNSENRMMPQCVPQFLARSDNRKATR